METYSEQLENIINKAVENVQTLIEEKGTESEHSHEICLKVKDNKFQFNLEAGRYLTEVYANSLVDDSGYTYGFYGVLGTEELLQLIDYLVKEYDK